MKKTRRATKSRSQKRRRTNARPKPRVPTKRAAKNARASNARASKAHRKVRRTASGAMPDKKRAAPRPKRGRKKHPTHLRTETIGFALYDADKRILMRGCAKRGMTKSSAFRLAIRLWEAGGFKMDAQAHLDKDRGNRDPIRVARENAAKNRAAKRSSRPTRRAPKIARPKAPRTPKAAPAPSPEPAQQSLPTPTPAE